MILVFSFRRYVLTGFFSSRYWTEFPSAWFRQKDNEHNYVMINGKEVERINEYRYMGVLFDEKVDWA